MRLRASTDMSPIAKVADASKGNADAKPDLTSSERKLRNALNAARADAAAMAMDCLTKMKSQNALEGVARELQTRNTELEERNAKLVQVVSEELDSIRARTEEQESVRLRMEKEIELLNQQRSILEQQCAMHEERAERTEKAMDACEKLCEAKLDAAGERARLLEAELASTREELSTVLKRELALVHDMKQYGEKLEEFKVISQKNDTILEEYHEEITLAKNEALMYEKEKLKAQLHQREANAKLIEVYSEREALAQRCAQLEKSNTMIENLSRSLSEKLKTGADTAAA